jgi:hypothetical protein
MTFLPIVGRELRVAARRHATHSIRLWIGLGAMIVGIFLFIGSPGKPGDEIARRIFIGVSGLAMVYCLASGRLLTADCISSEKREGTLGLLFLTDLKGYDVVCGKLAATSFRALYGLLALVPVLAVPLLLGGLTNGEVWRMVLVLVNTFLFSLAVGVFSSALCQESRRAMGANFLILLLLIGVPSACAAAIMYFTPTNNFVPEMLYSCPVYSFVLTSATYFKRWPAHFWWSIGVVHALAWLLVVAASQWVVHAWQDLPAERGRLRWRDYWRAWVYGRPGRRLALRKKLLNVNAFYWLSSRAWFKPVGVWIALGFIACWWLYVWLQLQFSWREEIFVLITFILLNSLFKLWIAVETSQRLAEDQKIGALELLLSTPLSVRDIVRGQLLALRRQFFKPLLVVLAFEIFLTLANSRQPSKDIGMLPLGVTFVIILLADSAALIWVAMATALTAKTPNHASLSTISRVLLLPLVAYCAIAILVSAWTLTRGQLGPNWKFYLYLWFWLGIIADIAFGLPAWWRLQTRFRQLALRRFTSARSAVNS